MTSNNSKSVMQLLAEKLEGTFIERKYDEQQKVKVDVDGFEIIFDYYVNYTTSAVAINNKFTRVILPFTSTSDFQFEIYQKSLFSTLGQLLRFIQTVESSDKKFDAQFVTKSNDSFKVKSFLRSKEIRELIAKHPKFNFSISTDKGVWGSKLPKNHFELTFYTNSLITDFRQFQSLLELFKLSLSQLKEIGVIKPIS